MRLAKSPSWWYHSVMDKFEGLEGQKVGFLALSITYSVISIRVVLAQSKRNSDIPSPG